jgi:hypothetical protein
MRPPRRPVRLLRRQARPSSGHAILEQVSSLLKASTPAQLCASRLQRPDQLRTMRFALTDAPQSAGGGHARRADRALGRIECAPATTPLFCGAARALEAAGAPSTRGAQRGGGQGRAGPAAPERSPPGLRSPLAPGPGSIPGASPAVRAVPGQGAPRALDDRRSYRTAPRQSDAVLGRGELGCALQALPRRQNRAQRPLGLSLPPGGGRSFVYGTCWQGPAGPPPVCAREIREGGYAAAKRRNPRIPARKSTSIPSHFVRF